VAFEMAERMVLREKRDPAAAAEFATALFLGGIKALPHSTADGAAVGTWATGTV
jgi:hypothetical protein